MNSRNARASSARIVVFLFLLLCYASAAFAQAGRGAINGLVSDPSGAIIPGASVVAMNQATGVKLWIDQVTILSSRGTQLSALQVAIEEQQPDEWSALGR